MAHRIFRYDCSLPPEKANPIPIVDCTVFPISFLELPKYSLDCNGPVTSLKLCFAEKGKKFSVHYFFYVLFLTKFSLKTLK